MAVRPRPVRRDNVVPFTNKGVNLGDSVINYFSNMGTNLDKRRQSTFKRVFSSRDWQQLRDIYRSEWVGRKVVDIIADDMTKKWRKFNGTISPEDIKRLTRFEKKLLLPQKFNEAIKLSRLYGGALAVLNIEGTGSPDTPLNLDRVKPGSFKFINIVDASRVNNNSPIISLDPYSENFEMPEFYRFSGDVNQTRVHHTRVLRFDGHRIPFDERKNNGYWHDSVISSIYEDMLNLTTTTHGIASLVHEANIDVYKIKAFATNIASPKSRNELLARFEEANFYKSQYNALLLDGTEEYDRKATAFSGLEETARLFLTIVSAASDIPETRFLGQDAAGFSNGDISLANYYDRVNGDQINNLGPHLHKLDIIMARSLGIPFEEESEDLAYEFRPLKILNAEEESQRKLNEATSLVQLVDAGIMTRHVAAMELQESDDYSNVDEAMVLEIAHEEVDAREREEEAHQADMKTAASSGSDGSSSGSGSDSSSDGSKKGSDKDKSATAGRAGSTSRVSARQQRGQQTVKEKRRTLSSRQKARGGSASRGAGGGGESTEKARQSRRGGRSANEFGNGSGAL